jgi:arsenate reductase (glutaredoxin)
MIVYGIKNCSTVKKALDWLDAHSTPYHFHNYKKDGISQSLLKHWCKTHGWEMLLNRKGTSFRAVPEEEKLDLNEAKAVALMLANTSLIKRPIVEGEGFFHAGFNEEAYERLFGR